MEEKNLKELSVDNKILLKTYALNPEEWLLEEETENVIKIVHKYKKTEKCLYKDFV